MTVAAMSWAFEQDLPPAEKLVLVALGDESGADGNDWHVWPSDALAHKVSMTPAELVQVMATLESWGYIVLDEADKQMLTLTQGRRG